MINPHFSHAHMDFIQQAADHLPTDKKYSVAVVRENNQNKAVFNTGSWFSRKIFRLKCAFSGKMEFGKTHLMENLIASLNPIIKYETQQVNANLETPLVIASRNEIQKTLNNINKITEVFKSKVKAGSARSEKLEEIEKLKNSLENLNKQFINKELDLLESFKLEDRSGVRSDKQRDYIRVALNLVESGGLNEDQLADLKHNLIDIIVCEKDVSSLPDFNVYMESTNPEMRELLGLITEYDAETNETKFSTSVALAREIYSKQDNLDELIGFLVSNRGSLHAIEKLLPILDNRIATALASNHDKKYSKEFLSVLSEHFPLSCRFLINSTQQKNREEKIGFFNTLDERVKAKFPKDVENLLASVLEEGLLEQNVSLLKDMDISTITTFSEPISAWLQRIDEGDEQAESRIKGQIGGQEVNLPQLLDDINAKRQTREVIALLQRSDGSADFLQEKVNTIISKSEEFEREAYRDLTDRLTQKNDESSRRIAESKNENEQSFEVLSDEKTPLMEEEKVLTERDEVFFKQVGGLINTLTYPNRTILITDEDKSNIARILSTVKNLKPPILDTYSLKKEKNVIESIREKCGHVLKQERNRYDQSNEKFVHMPTTSQEILDALNVKINGLNQGIENFTGILLPLFSDDPEITKLITKWNAAKDLSERDRKTLVDKLELAFGGSPEKSASFLQELRLAKGVGGSAPQLGSPEEEALKAIGELEKMFQDVSPLTVERAMFKNLDIPPAVELASLEVEAKGFEQKFPGCPHTKDLEKLTKYSQTLAAPTNGLFGKQMGAISELYARIEHLQGVVAELDKTKKAKAAAQIADAEIRVWEDLEKSMATLAKLAESPRRDEMSGQVADLNFRQKELLEKMKKEEEALAALTENKTTLESMTKMWSEKENNQPANLGEGLLKVAKNIQDAESLVKE